MTDVLVAPTERPPISQLGQTSSLCEKLGVDILWESPNGMCGCQRKAQLDLIASVRDGRLGKELMQVQSLAHRFLVIEGQPGWDREGNLMSPHTRWTIRQQQGVELSAQRAGVLVLHTRSALETCSTIEYLVDWTAKKEHVSSLLAVSGPKKNGWGRYDERTMGIVTLSTWPGVSTELAQRIFDFYGHVPCRHDLSERALTEVPGIGKKKAAAIAKVLA